jgi:hypothetical protein
MSSNRVSGASTSSIDKVASVTGRRYERRSRGIRNNSSGTGLRIASTPKIKTPSATHARSGDEGGIKYHAIKLGGINVSMPAKNNAGDSSVDDPR